MSDFVEVRVPRLPACDLDYIRRHARAHGLDNTATAAVRFAVVQLAMRLRAEDKAFAEKRASRSSEISDQEGFEFP